MRKYIPAVVAATGGLFAIVYGMFGVVPTVRIVASAGSCYYVGFQSGVETRWNLSSGCTEYIGGIPFKVGAP